MGTFSLNSFFFFKKREDLPIPLIYWFLHMEPFFLVFLQDPSITLKCIDKRSHGTKLMTFHVLMPPAAFQAQVQFSGCSSSAYPRELEHVWDTGNGFRLEEDSFRWDLLSTFQFLAAASMPTPVGSGHGFPFPEGISPWAGSGAPPQTEHHTSRAARSSQGRKGQVGEGERVLKHLCWQEGPGTHQTELFAFLSGEFDWIYSRSCLQFLGIMFSSDAILHSTLKTSMCFCLRTPEQFLFSPFWTTERGWEWAPWKAEETPDVSQQKELCKSHSCGHFGHINEVLRLSITCQSTQDTH